MKLVILIRLISIKLMMIRRKMIRRENDESLINDVCGKNNNNNNDYKMKNDQTKVLGSRVLQNRNDDDCRNGSRDDVGGKTPLYPLSLALSNLLAKHHAVHHAQNFSY